MDDPNNGDFNEFASTGAITEDNPSTLVDDSPENPTTVGLSSGGAGTSIDTGLDQTGGPTGSGGGVVDRIGGRTTVGGESTGSLDTGSGMPPKPDFPDDRGL